MGTKEIRRKSLQRIPQYRKLTDIIHAEGIPAITQLALGAYKREIKT